MEEQEIIGIVLSALVSIILVFLLLMFILWRLSNERTRKQQDIFNAVLKAQSEEQKRVGQDLHDDVGPLMASIYNRLELVLSKNLQESSNSSILKEIQQEVRQTSDQIRKASHDLIPIDF